MKQEQQNITPERNTYEPQLMHARITDLPFVREGQGKGHYYWDVPNVDAVSKGSDLGREYAAHYLQFKTQSGGRWAALSGIVDAMMKGDHEKDRYIRWGFLCFIEEMASIAANSIDVYEYLDRKIEREKEYQKEYEAEVAEEEARIKATRLANLEKARAKKAANREAANLPHKQPDLRIVA